MTKTVQERISDLRDQSIKMDRAMLENENDCKQLTDDRYGFMNELETLNSRQNELSRNINNIDSELEKERRDDSRLREKKAHVVQRIAELEAEIEYDDVTIPDGPLPFVSAAPYRLSKWQLGIAVDVPATAKGAHAGIVQSYDVECRLDDGRNGEVHVNVTDNFGGVWVPDGTYKKDDTITVKARARAFIGGSYRYGEFGPTGHYVFNAYEWVVISG